jgi:polyisoprenoid-binding protein YceI
MKLKMAALSAGVLIVLGGAYTAYDYYAGNHVTIQEVIPASTSGQASGKQVAANVIDGEWTLKPDSKVYFSVTTSKETVNFEGSSVKGKWLINNTDASKMNAEAVVDINSLQSGNPQRDGHVKGADYLNAAKFPEAKFQVKTFKDLPKEWKEGEQVTFSMSGTLTVKDISKEVLFESKAVYSQGIISMEGNTVVTFNDFGMKNPHTVMLDTQNNVAVQLRLNLEKK